MGEEMMTTSDGEEFTHIVELYHRHPSGGGGGEIGYSTDPNTRAQKLRIGLPPTSYAYAPFGAHPYERKLLSSSSSCSSARGSLDQSKPNRRNRRLCDDVVSPQSHSKRQQPHPSPHQIQTPVETVTQTETQTEDTEMEMEMEERESYFLELDSWDEAGIPTLTLSQLRATQGFLRSSGFHLTSNSHSNSSSSPHSPTCSSQPRILIITPRDDRTDALSILSLFLATQSGRKVSDVFGWLDSRQSRGLRGSGSGSGSSGVMGVWQHVVSSRWQREVGNRLI